MNHPPTGTEMDASLATGGRHGVVKWLEGRLIQEVGTGAPNPTRRAGFASLEEQHTAIRQCPLIQTPEQARLDNLSAMLPSQRLRKELGLAQREFVKLLGIGTHTLAKRENGRHVPYSEQDLKRMMKGKK